MKVYGNHCNAGTIHRELQPAFEPEPPVPVKPLPVIAPPEPEWRGKRAVIRVEDGKRYEKIRDAAREMGLKSPSNIRTAIRMGGTCKGYHWRDA